MSPGTRRGHPEGKGLQGRSVVVTRPAEDAPVLARLLEGRGATVLLAPAIERGPVPESGVDGAIGRLAAGAFDWVVFTSAAGVRAVADRMASVRPGAGGVRARVAAVGTGTASALRERGIEPHLVPETFTTAALGRAMPDGPGSVLLARADIASEELQEDLHAKGWTTETLDAYTVAVRTTMPPDVARAIREGRVDAVTFTSASTVVGFLVMAGPLLGDGVVLPPAVCIGPVTAERARRDGLRVDAVADSHTIEGLVAAVERTLGGRGKERPG